MLLFNKGVDVTQLVGVPYLINLNLAGPPLILLVAPPRPRASGSGYDEVSIEVTAGQAGVTVVVNYGGELIRFPLNGHLVVHHWLCLMLLLFSSVKHEVQDLWKLRYFGALLGFFSLARAFLTFNCHLNDALSSFELTVDCLFQVEDAVLWNLQVQVRFNRVHFMYVLVGGAGDLGFVFDPHQCIKLGLLVFW